MSTPSYTYTVAVGDMDSGYEYPDELKARYFAKGARFVLNNTRQENFVVTVTKLEHSDNPVTGAYEIKEVGKEEY
jgi:hypothetical protein